MKFFRILTAVVLFTIGLATPGKDLAQPAPAQPPAIQTATQSTTTPPAPPAAEASEAAEATPASPDTAAEGQGANDTRERFLALVREQPPQVGKVLKLNPSLFNDPAYLANYPALQKFITEHPEIAHSPAFYLEDIWAGEALPESAAERVWRDAMQGFAIFLTMTLIASVLIWLVKTLIQYRRWSRVSRVQAEVHNKLMDRFATNEELLTYIATPSGKRFLETAPLTIDSAQPAIGAPASRILWSTQIGMVVMAGGIGLWFVSGNVQKDIAQPLSALGILGVAIGLGFIASAVVSFVLSRKLGLWGTVTETPAPLAD
jgi:hypothetical protein